MESDSQMYNRGKNNKAAIIPYPYTQLFSSMLSGSSLLMALKANNPSVTLKEEELY